MSSDKQQFGINQGSEGSVEMEATFLHCGKHKIEKPFLSLDDCQLTDSAGGAQQENRAFVVSTCKPRMHQNLTTLRVHFFINNVLGVLTANRAVQW